MKKFLLYGLLAVVVVVGAGVGYLYYNLDSIVRDAIESKGSELVGVKVTVKSVQLSPFSGEGTIKGLKIGNPPGFDAPTAVRADEVSVGIDLKSLRTPVAVINRVVLKAPRVDLIRDKKKGSNLKQIMNNLEASAPAEPKEKEAPAGPAKKLIIGLFSVTGGEVQVGGERVEGRTHDLAPVKLQDMGTDAGGMTSQEAATRIGKALAKAAGEESAAVQTVKGAANAVKGAGEKVKGAGQKARGAVKERRGR